MRLSVKTSFPLLGAAFALLTSSCSVPERGSFGSRSFSASTVRNTLTISTNPGSNNSYAANYSMDSDVVAMLKKGIQEQRFAGHPDYNPVYGYVVDPSKQEMKVYDVRSWTPKLTIPVGTGKRGLGFGGAQTPTGFFTMGGVRIAKNSSAYIQTGDSRKGVSGVYAEMLYPPSHSEKKLHGRVPNNVIIHGFNPKVSQMLHDRHHKNMIGRVPCTTGCPVPGMNDLPKLTPFLKRSAGQFDPTARPNAALRSLIRKGQVTEYYTEGRLGDPILILDRPFKG